MAWKDAVREKGMSPIFRTRLLDLSPFLLPIPFSAPYPLFCSHADMGVTLIVILNALRLLRPMS